MTRKYIDMVSYPRLDHFRHFMTMQQPCVSVTVQVDITDWLIRQRASGCPFFLSFQYAVVRAANRIPEFRQRIVDEKIVEYDYCNPSYIVSLPDDTYRYCNVNVYQPFAQYLKEGRVKQDAALHSEHLEEEEGDVLGLLFISCVPWLNYTEAMMPYPGGSFSNPGFCWGGYKTEKYLALEDGRVTEKVKTTIPVSLFFNHALIDGIHAGRFFDYLNEELNNFDFSTKE
ncbi:MAG: chloramphenicol acetyltransferase [Lachnospiraceae bacterium]|nr:chloramphenicol acetyltransferase [Lachnospiraceae bacterium]